MRDDEFNFIKITNEGENPNFEFGSTPSSESTSYSDNSDRFHDEINDNPHSNNTNKNQEKEKERKEEEQQRQQEDNSSNNESHSSSSSSSSSSGASGGAAGGATGAVSGAVVGASLVSVVALSAVVGINLYINAKCEVASIDSSFDTISYDLNLTDVENDVFAITLSNNLLSYKESQDLQEGSNKGVFKNLKGNTEYTLEVIDVSASNYAIYTQTVKTLEDDPNIVTISFSSNGGTGTMAPVRWPKGEAYPIPRCEFTYEGHEFKCWSINDEVYEVGQEIYPETNTTIVANWDILQVTITFEANNGTSETKDPIVLDYGTTYTLPENPFSDPDEHMMFRGWQINGTYAGKYYSWKVKVDTVLTATWTDADIITYNDSNDSDPQTFIVKIEKDSNIFTTLSESPFEAPEGQELRYWRIGNNQVNLGATVSYSGDVTVYAVWATIGQYTISFDPGSGSVGPVDQEPLVGAMNEEVILPDCVFVPPDDSMAFDCWEDQNGRQYPVESPFIIRGDEVLTARYKNKTVKYITYYWGTAMSDPYYSDTAYVEDNPYALLSEMPSGWEAPEGKELGGWMNTSGIEYALGEEIYLDAYTSDTAYRYYAIWNDAGPEFSGVTFTSIDHPYGDNNDYTFKFTVAVDDPNQLATNCWLKVSENGDQIFRVDLSYPFYQEQTLSFTASSALDLTTKNHLYEYEIEATVNNETKTYLTGVFNPTYLVSSQTIDINKSKLSNQYNGSFIPNSSNGTSGIPINITYNTDLNGSEDYYLRFSEVEYPDNSNLDPTFINNDFTYVPLVKTHGAQIAWLPFVLASPNNYTNNLWDAALCAYDPDPASSSSYSPRAYISSGQKEIDGSMHRYYSINEFGSSIASIMTGYFLESDEVFTASDEITPKAIYVDGNNIGSIPGSDITITLTFDFVDVSSTVIESYALDVTTSMSDIAEHGKIMALFGDIVNTSDSSKGFGDFLKVMKRYPATVKLAYTGTSSGYNNTITMYEKFMFSVQ